MNVAEWTIRRGTPADYEEIIDLADLAFCIRFRDVVPSLYDGHPETAQEHYLLYEEDRLCALLISHPVLLSVGDHVLHTRCIGTVSVHPRARKRGYMRALMNRAIADARAEGADLMFLGGQRQRYGHFGFEETGIYYEYRIGPGEVQRLSRDQSVHIVPLEGDLIRQAQALYEAQPIHAERTDFLSNLHNEGGRPAAFLRKDRFIGYFTQGNDRVREFYSCTASDTVDAALCAVEAAGRTLHFLLPPDQRAAAAALSAVSASSCVHTGAMYLVLRPIETAGALLALRAREEGLRDGRLVCESQESALRFALEVRHGEVHVCETSDAADLSLPARELTRALFSPDGLLLAGRSPMRDWLPLPLCVPMQDEV